MRTQDKIIVGFVWCLIFFQALSFLYLFVPQLYEQSPLVFFLLVPLFIVVVSILCVSYFRSTWESPGKPNYQVNMRYTQQLEDIKNYARREAEEKKARRKNKRKGKIDLEQIKSLNQIGFCFKCDVVKEERVHHCSICRQCIMRMDHHCPWVGNCVGKLNHKYFILFLFYATWGLLTVAISVHIDYVNGGSIFNTLNESEKIWIAIACVTSYMLALAIGFLFVTQMITSCQNITTLENFTEGIQEHNPWYQGSVIENLRDIFGDSIWVLPTNPFSYTRDDTMTLEAVAL